MVLVAASQLDDNIAVLEWLQTASYLIEVFVNYNRFTFFSLLGLVLRNY